MAKQYSSANLDAAVDTYLGGARLGIVTRAYPSVPRQTITYSAKKKKEGVAAKKPGTKPLLTTKVEDDLQAWIVGMQQAGHPVSREMVLVKGNKIYHLMYGNRRSVGDLGHRWLEQFMG